MSWRGWRLRLLLVAVDGLAWAVALVVVTWFRLELEATQVDGSNLVRFLLLVLVLQWAVGLAAHLYRGRYWVGSQDEAAQLARVMIVVGLVALVVDSGLSVPLVPRSVPLTSAFAALVTAWGMRYALRRAHERTRRPDQASAQRVIIFGAGRNGWQLVRSMLSDPESGYLPVALLDDDASRRTLRICGVPVSGGRSDLADVVARTGATLLVIAVRDPDAALLQELYRKAQELGVGVRVLPPLCDVFRPGSGVTDLPELDVSDLLGRRQIDTRIDAIGGVLANKRVMVTGAGGSIGSELCRQIHRLGPAELFMLDRDESALHTVRLSIHGSALLDSSDVVLADIRDPEVVRAVFETCRPDVVFHAAALKHLPLLEQYPLEAWKTNVLGTHHVLEAARSVGVSTFVNISTDKAANPTSVLGQSKRIGERLTADAATRSEGRYLSVRFGNVLGSRGSVLTTFKEQLVQGGPITITHPEVTRYFMTIPEAVQLVIQAAAIGRSGEALVLDMGDPVRIADLACHLVEKSGKSAQIVYTGLRGGEKLHEELFGPGELDTRPLHPAISHVSTRPLDPAHLWALALELGEVEAMAECCAEQPLPAAAVPAAAVPAGTVPAGTVPVPRAHHRDGSVTQ
ncbi:nucleoside-diphosphate sugar epimerase/dehydratase [Saccharothrix sp.]|uniref:polysaccharide biosynthesis protein n=1 Tax=Saccharothrix sp. TaxID=1873460 RepID=UPI002811EB87|nr:nucleoside-diphosphate sugar epimerase/dehydratase [Saccharothrix sp.]